MIPEDFTILDGNAMGSSERWITMICPRCNATLGGGTMTLGRLANQAEQHIRDRHRGE